jgi:hypothetical protein
MKKSCFATVVVILLVSMVSWAIAFETDFDDLRAYDRSLPGWKLGRGLGNIISGPQEIFANATNGAIEGQYAGAYSEGLNGAMFGAANGFVAGFGVGVCKALRRTTLGFLEVLTFWKPEYGPTMDPQYGTRCKAWGTQDYFDPDPFWYWGPER